MDPVEFKADLAHMKQVMGSVNTESGHIRDAMNRIAGEFGKVAPAWDSPAEKSFDDVQRWFTRAQNDLNDLLDEIGRRLKQAYDNYHSAEYANLNNNT